MAVFRHFIPKEKIQVFTFFTKKAPFHSPYTIRFYPIRAQPNRISNRFSAKKTSFSSFVRRAFFLN